MPHTTYPVAADLDSLLTAAGVDTSTLDLATAIASGISAFEHTTGRLPMLAGADVNDRSAALADRSRTFDPPSGADRVLDLGADLASLTTLTINGTAQTLGTDFWLEPANALPQGRAYRFIHFSLSRWCFSSALPLPQWKNSIAITGRWGFNTAIPDDAWLAMVELAALTLYEQWRHAGSAGMASIAIGSGDLDVKFGSGVPPLIARWEKHAAETCRRYQVVS
jgi:hypothetical protein